MQIYHLGSKSGADVSETVLQQSQTAGRVAGSPPVLVPGRRETKNVSTREVVSPSLAD